MHLKKKRKNLYGNSYYSTEISKSERLRYNKNDRSIVLKSAFGK